MNIGGERRTFTFEPLDVEIQPLKAMDPHDPDPDQFDRDPEWDDMEAPIVEAQPV
jgi:hypothetical protein